MKRASQRNNPQNPGQDLVTVATLMGHKSLDTTAIYTQPSEEDMVRALEKLSMT